MAAVNIDDSEHQTYRFVLGCLLEAKGFAPICNVVREYLIQESSSCYVR